MGENIFSKTITVLVLFCTSLTQHTLGQTQDNFSDGNLTSNPTWSGTITDFQIDALNRLQLNAPTQALGGGNSFITLPFTIPNNHNTQWEFVVSHNFSATGTSNGRIYLMSDNTNLSGPLNGYYLQFGEANAGDRIELFKQTGTSSSSVWRTPEPSIAALFTIRVRVTRSSIGAWQIYVDPTGGNNFVTQGGATDNTITSASFFGINCRFNNDNFRDDFFYDDIIIATSQAPDVTAPVLNTVSTVNTTQIDLNFSEALNTSVALVPTAFVLNDTVQASEASFQGNNSVIRLTFAHALKNGYSQNIQHPALSDPSGNTLAAGSKNFLFFQAVATQANDIVINELYADPSPSIGLPAYEFVEIYNKSVNPVQLEGWTITDGTTIGTLTNRILLPGEFLTLCPQDAGAAYTAFGPTMPLQYFPSLNNAGDNVQLKTPDGFIVDAQSYALTTYLDDDKDAGGYTLERIDPTDHCKGTANWKASNNASGGSPGQQNSVYALAPDVIGPQLLEVIPKTSKTVTIKFDEKLSSLAPAITQLTISPSVEKSLLSFSNSQHSEIDLLFTSDLDSALIYTITATGIEDCPGNTLQSTHSAASFKMDMVKPTVVAVNVINQQRLEIVFSERIKSETITPQSVFFPDFGSSNTRTLSPDLKNLIFEFDNTFVNGKSYSVVIKDLADISNNTIDSSQYSFRFFEALPAVAGDIIINELLADPSPVVNLPEAEFIEIFNRSSKAFDLTDWKITDGSSIGVLPNKIILPDEHVIICQTASVSAFTGFGSVLGVTNFPSLNNSGDLVKLIHANGLTIDSVQYASDWYQRDGKEDGGWSLERINPNDFCKDKENWEASADSTGGSPGKRNSIFKNTSDVIPPLITGLDVVEADSIVINFNERLAGDATMQDNFLSTVLNIDTISFASATWKSIGLKLNTPLDSLTAYSLVLQNIRDCPGNSLHADSASVLFKLDNVLPKVTKAEMFDFNTVVITISEKLQGNATDPNHFSVDGMIPDVASISANKIQLHFSQPFENGRSYRLIVSALEDLAGNKSILSSHDIVFFQGGEVIRKDIIISEIFADPTPVIGLPETEFVELHNRSQNAVQLKNWTFGDATHQATLSDFILLPGSNITLTLSSKTFQFTSDGSVMGLSGFPTLTNSGEPLILKDSTGVLIDSVFYSDVWYRDSEKKDGGWSLELIDPENICNEGENWISSTDVKGGTPGKMNSVLASKPDLTAPELISIIAIAPDTLSFRFNEKLDNNLPALSAFEFTPSVVVESIHFSDMSMRGYNVKLSAPLEFRMKYTGVVSEIYDCAGNRIEGKNQQSFALPEDAVPGDVVINEILFDPRTTGVDFVEIFNRSEKYLDLRNWKAANFEDDTVRNKRIISTGNFILPPADFLVLTAEPNVLKGEYLQADEEKMIKVVMPTLSDDEGTFALIDDAEIIIDTLFYTDDQHSPFLKDAEGISLERIDPYAPASNKDNWHSASASSGYATPGLSNSSVLQNVFEESVSVHPEIFIPGESQPDFAMISYNLEHAGYVANVKIVNATGRVVKEVAHNELLGTEGFLKWHGDNHDGTKASVGAYMIWFEVFDSEGTVITIKKRVAVAARF